MFWSSAGNVIPSAKCLSASLLAKEDEHVVEEIKDVLKDQEVVISCVVHFLNLRLHVLMAFRCDGVKDVTKKSLTGVVASHDYKVC